MRTFSFCLQLWWTAASPTTCLVTGLFLPQLQFCSLSRQTDLDQPFQQLDELVLLPAANKTESCLYFQRKGNRDALYSKFLDEAYFVPKILNTITFPLDGTFPS